MAEITDALVPTEEVTATAEEPVVETTADQDEDANVRDFEAKLETALQLLTENAQRLREEAEARAVAEAKAAELDRIYKGYQASTTPKLQRLAEIERRQQSEQAVTSRLDSIERMLQTQTMANMLPEERERYELQIERQKLETERAALQQAKQQPIEQPSAIDVEVRKRELFSRYFPDSSLDVRDPRIDWAMDAPDWPTWEARFRTSVQTIELERGRQSFDTEREAILQTATERVRQAQEESTRVVEEARRAAAVATAEARERARLEKEERLRALGADVIEPAIPEGTLGPRSLEEQFPIDPAWLTSGDPALIRRFEENSTARKRLLQQAIAERAARRR